MSGEAKYRSDDHHNTPFNEGTDLEVYLALSQHFRAGFQTPLFRWEGVMQIMGQTDLRCCVLGWSLENARHVR